MAIKVQNRKCSKSKISRKIKNLVTNCIVAEEANSRRKSNVLSNLNSRSHVVTNSSENENTFSMNSFVSGDVTYVDAVKSVKRFLFEYRRNGI